MARKTILFTLIALLLLAAAGAVPPQASDTPFEAIRAAAEREYAEKSYSRAHTLYESALKLELKPAERRWVTFRLADTAWRADAAAPNPDPTVRDAARKSLEELATSPENDLVRAEANESLGDYFARHPRHRDVHQALRWYQAALEYWAGSEDLALARRRYLSIVWRMADDHGWGIPREVLVNAVQIAETPADRARARMLLAQQLMNEGRPETRERAFELYDEVIALGRQIKWYDEALYQYAAHTTDYVKALELYRRIVREFKAGETPYHDDAVNAIADITRPAVMVMTGQTFLPESEQEVVLVWRNVKQIELALYPIDLTRDAKLGDNAQWIDTLPLNTVARRWTHDTQDTGQHRPGQATIPISPRVEPGAYVLVARSGEVTSRALFLVSDAHILVHYEGDRMDVFVSDVETGEPLPNARVHISGIAPDNKSRRGRPFTLDGKTNADGLATLQLRDHGQVLVTAHASAGKQAYHQMHVWMRDQYIGADWRIYAFTDRPAYRPNETVQWKAIARVRENERWRTPAGVSLEYDIMSPRNEKVASGTAKLNAYGSLWGELALTPTMALGQYTIVFRDPKNHVGSAPLFRLEEYKLPEFAVTVSTPEGKQYRLGDTIEATIDATYYFGGPVANAEVEVVVYQSPFYRYWYPWRVHDWYWKDSYVAPPSEVMTRQTLRTDENGRAIVRIPTPRDATDTSYRIEARVVDASRREVRGEGNVRVMRQRYSVMAVPEHFIHRPGDPAVIRFRTVDANDKPVQVTGTVEVIRRRWKNRQYTEENVLTTKLSTNAEGEATLTFTPKSIGYYLVRWTSFDGEGTRERDKVIAETTIWVADPATTELGYFHRSGIDIIVDKESMRAGETATALLVTPASGRWVVLTTSGDRIMDTRVLRMEGTAKVVQISLNDQHVPNFFLTASSVFGRQIATTSEQIVVPPAEHFLNVEVKSDREEYGPRDEGTLTITTRDAANKPVSAEVAVAVSDEAVTAIQRDLAGDPRQFFFSDLRHGTVQVSGSLHSQQYVLLKEKDLEEKEEADLRRRREAGFRDEAGAGAAYAYDAVQEAVTVTAQAATVAPPPPPAAPVPSPVPAPEMAKMAGEPPAGIDVQVRADFRSTAFWKPDVITDANGTATVKVQFPEALTTWRATARAATTGSAFGMASSTARTNLPLLVRLQAPRFFVAGDRVTVSAVINNNTDAPMTVTPELHAEGLSGGGAGTPLQLPAHGDARADWIVTADKPGDAKLRVTARGAQFGDAMEKPFVVYEHGIDKLIARSGKLRGDEALVRLELPAQRRATDLVVRIQPSLAAALLDALPYLLEFPYGCTEQTMSRFLPAAVLAKTTGKKPANLDAIVKAGLERLYSMQHPNGGWGWWKEGPDDDWMTAYVVWGLSIARDAGIEIEYGALNRGGEWLSRRLVENRGRTNELAWMLHALSAWRGKFPVEAEQRAASEVWENRERLTAYGRALFALTAHRWGQAERAQVMIRNLEDGVQLDRGDDAAEAMATAHWGASGFWWRWQEGPVETTAFALQALVTIDPQHRLVEPAMNWLVKNRRGAQWTNTRDTAIAILALNDYVVKTGELQGDAAYELTVNGRVIATQSGEGRFSIDPAVLRDTTQEIRIRRTSGKGPLYFATEARFVSLEEPVTKAGNELFVKRDYFRLEPRPTLLKGVRYEQIPLRDRDSIASGERIEVLLTVDVKNDYEYLIFEDLKPGGFEAVELQSGQSLHATSPKTGRTAWVYQELRDRKVALFIDKLPQGTWEIRYTLRAETPGQFHALPVLGWAMYVPDIRGNSDEVRVTVTE